MSSTADISNLLGESLSLPNPNETEALDAFQSNLTESLNDGPPVPSPGNEVEQEKTQEEEKEQKSLIELMLEFAETYSGQQVEDISEADLDKIEMLADEMLQSMGMTQEQSQELIDGFKDAIGMKKEQGLEAEEGNTLENGPKKGLDDELEKKADGPSVGNKQERSEEAGNTQENIDTPAVDAPSLGGMKPG